jgi:mRNA interferase RelE/StbE
VAEYSVTVARPARKELERLSNVLVRRLIRKIEDLSSEPRPFGCRKLAGEENLWRIRVGDYRIVYSIHDNERMVDIVRIRHRSEAYR